MLISKLENLNHDLVAHFGNTSTVCVTPGDYFFLTARLCATLFTICSNWGTFNFVPEDKRLELTAKGNLVEQLEKAFTGN
jgi:hypothetical protein